MKKVLLVALLMTGCTAPELQPQPQPAPAPTPAPTPAPKPDDQVAAILDVVKSSSCSSYFWKDRGRAPAGYMKGLALMYKNSYCRFKGVSSAAQVMGQELGTSDKDALAWYAKDAKTDLGRLKNTYVLLTGLGMRESSGSYGCGPDRSAGFQRPEEAETGLYQFSYNSIGSSPALKALYEEYKARPEKCMLDVFKEGAKPVEDRYVTPKGAAYDFQVFVRTCPALQVEYAAVGVRVLRKHWGPINRKEAEYLQACSDMYTKIEDILVCK